MTYSKPLSCLALAFLSLAISSASPSAASWPVKGKVLSSHPVKDSLGTGHVVLTRQVTTALDAQTQIIRAYRFNEGADGPVKVWQMTEGVENCDVSTLASFGGEAPILTDLDGDGLAEIWMSYVCMCQGDVSPIDLTLVMYEGRKKHAMRGLTLDMAACAESFVDDDGQMDQAFQKAPQAIKDYAQNFWYRKRFSMRPTAADEEEEPASEEAQPSEEDECPYAVDGKVFWHSHFADKLGEGSLVFTKEEKQSQDGQAAVLRAYRFTGSPDSPKTVWKIEDGTGQCGAGGASADFFSATPILTDLDSNGVQEVWTGYTFGCGGASGPVDLKIVMHEGEKRYVMHGKTSTGAASGVVQGSEGEMDQNFKEGPAAFRSFASKLWLGWRTGHAQ